MIKKFIVLAGVLFSSSLFAGTANVSSSFQTCKEDGVDYFCRSHIFIKFDGDFSSNYTVKFSDGRRFDLHSESIRNDGALTFTDDGQWGSTTFIFHENGNKDIILKIKKSEIPYVKDPRQPM